MMDMTAGERRHAFAIWIRTGRLPTVGDDGVERKFNPYHDPRNGRFTFAPGGPRALSRVVISQRRTPYVRPEEPGATEKRSQPIGGAVEGLAVEPSGPSKPGEGLNRGLGASIEAAIRSSRKAADAVVDDIRSIEQAIPSLAELKGFPLLVAIPDTFFDSSRRKADAAAREADAIMREVERVVPEGFASKLDIRRPIDSAVERLRDARLIRAAAAMKFQDDAAPMQVEMIRLMQKEADEAYDRGVKLLEGGKLRIHISRELTLGNYVDGQVRTAMRMRFDRLNVDTAGSGPVRINRRELETSGDERSYRRPDARVADMALDVTLSRKTYESPQIRGFFSADFRPRYVSIIRPSQVGKDNSYIITKPEMTK
jgi:hypothetical protein